MNTRGFTLIELLIVIAIMSIVVFVSFGLSVRGFTQEQVSTAGSQLESVVRRAQARSRAGWHDDTWGVFVDPLQQQYTLFKGGSYATRDDAYSEIFTFPSVLEYSGIEEIVFFGVRGMPNVTGNMQFLQPDTSDMYSISLNSYGLISH